MPMMTTAIVVDNSSRTVDTRAGTALSTDVGPIEESGPSVSPVEVFGGRMFPVVVSGVGIGVVDVYGGVGFIVVTRSPFFNSTCDKCVSTVIYVN